MSIPPADLRLRTGDTAIAATNGSKGVTKTWQAYHVSLGDTVGSGSVSAEAAAISQLQAADASAENLCGSAFVNVQSLHEPIAVIANYSAFDADLILDAWMQDEGGLHHPICGDIAQTPAGLVQRVNTILGARLPPPTWFWAEPGASQGELRVKCVAVPDADSYNVYSGETMIGTVATQGWETIPALTGAHSVRMAAVEGAQVGILSFAITVEVT